MFLLETVLKNLILEDDLKKFKLEDDLEFLKAVLMSPWVALLMLVSKLIQIPAISLLFRVGGRAGGRTGGWRN